MNGDFAFIYAYFFQIFKFLLFVYFLYTKEIYSCTAEKAPLVILLKYFMTECPIELEGNNWKVKL